MKLLIRAEAYAEMGTGHLMRCIALAQACVDSGWQVIFVTYCTSGSLLHRLRDKEGFTVHELDAPGDLSGTLELIRDERPDWTVLDGYHFDLTFQREVKAQGCKLLVIDDLAHLPLYDVDIILNQNFGAERLAYNIHGSARMLLGTEYVLLRREFTSLNERAKPIDDNVKKVLITMGGADADNNTAKVLMAMEAIKDELEIKVILGAGNPHHDSIMDKAEASHHDIDVVVAAEDMASLLGWPDIAVSAGGTTIWELAFMGVSSVLCIVADNQSESVEQLVQYGAFISAGRIEDIPLNELTACVWRLASDAQLRRELNNKCVKLVAGFGCKRVVDEMSLAIVPGVSIRRDFNINGIEFINYVNLSASQSTQVLELRNLPENRKWMLTGHLITASEDKSFIQGLRQRDDCFHWLVCDNAEVAGVGNLSSVNMDAGSAYLGILSKRKGAGKIVLSGLLYLWFEVLGMEQVKCELYIDNERARSLYVKFGFSDLGVMRYIKREDIELGVSCMVLSRADYVSSRE